MKNGFFNIGIRLIHVKWILFLGILLVLILGNNKSWGQNYAVSCDGNGDYVTIPNDPIWAFGTGDFTVSFWMTLNDINLVHDGLMAREDFQWLAFEYNHDWDHRLNLWIDHDGVNYWDFSMKSNKSDWIAGQWYHLAIVRNGNTIKMYVDGVLDNYAGYSLSVYNPGGPIYFGRSQLSNRFHNGMLDDLRIYSYGCSQADLQTQIYTQLQGNEPGLKGYWNMNISTGMTIPDLTNENNPATMIGDAVFIASTSPVSSVLASNSPFSPVDPTGLPYSVIFTAATINGANLPANSTIALYQGSLCVGAGFYNPSGNTQIITWKAAPSQGLPGFTAGSPMIAKIRSEWFGTMEVFLPAATWTSGNGTFGYGTFSVGSLAVSTGLLPGFTLSDNLLNYNAITIGNSVSDTITISNPGTALLSISSISTNNTAFTVSPSSLLIPAGSSATLVVNFAPTQVSVYSGILSLQTNYPSNPLQTVSLHGSGLPVPTPVALSNPGFLSFGSVAVGDTTMLEFSVSNGGNGELIISNIESSNLAYSLITSTSFSLQQNENHAVQVKFHPDAVTMFSAFVTVYTNAGNLVVPINGTGSAGYFNVVQATGLPYTILVDNVLIDSLFNLEFGDEVAVFDDTLCVGTGIAAGSGYAASFDGSGDYFYVPINVSETNYTVEMWFKTTYSNSGLFSVTSGGHDRNIYLYNGNIYTRVYSNEVINTSGINYADGNWHHVAHVFGGSEGGQKIYVDGVLKAQGSKSYSDFSWQGGVHIGYSEDMGYLNGQIDEVRIWSVARTESQISGDRYTSYLSVPNGLQAYFKMDGNAMDFGPYNYQASQYGNTSFALGTSFLTNQFVITAWQADATQNLTGFTPGHPMSFKIKAEMYGELIEMQATPTYTFGTGSFGFSPFSVVSLSANSGLDPEIHFSTTNLYCGQVQINQSISDTLVISNTGNAAATFTINGSSGVFSYSPNSGTIPPGGNAQIIVVFSPGTAGNHFFQLTVNSDDPQMASTILGVQGFGLPIGTSNIGITPQALSFNGVVLNSSKSLTFNVINTGTAALAVSNIVSTNSDFSFSPASFVLSNTNDNQLVTVTFTPTEKGISEGVLQLTSNAVPISLNVSGVGFDGHFQSPSETGLPYTIIIANSNLSGVFSPGDEIGVFDDTVCVGTAAILSGSSIQITAWQEDALQGFPGFHTGDSIRVKAWADINGFASELPGSPEFLIGDGTFGSGYMSVMNVEFLLPAISISPLEFFVALDEPDSTTSYLSIQNTGNESLQYRLQPGQFQIGSGSSLYLDGYDDFMSVGDWTAGSQWTLEAWVKASSAPAGRRTIIGGYNSCQDWGLTMADGHWAVSIRPPGGCTQNVTAPDVVEIGAWTHLVGSNDGTTARLYVNGVLVASAPVDAGVPGIYTSIRIGSEACCWNNSFPGWVDEAHIWNYARSTELIQQNMNLSITAPTTGLIGCWNFEDGDSSDLSGQSHNGTLINGASISNEGAPVLPKWLTFSFDVTALNAGNQNLAEIHFNSSGLIDGLYESGIRVLTNDPSTPWIDIPVSLNVTGFAQIAANVPSVSFGDVIVGNNVARSLLIKNIGTDSLWIDSVFVESGNVTGMSLLSSLTYPLIIAPLNQYQIQLGFSPSNDGYRTDELKIISNASNEDTLLVQLSGNGLTPADISLSSTFWDGALISGQSVTDSLYVYNTGQDTLSFSLAHSISWLSLEPAIGEIAVGDSMLVKLSISALGVYAGSYAGVMMIHSNDPDETHLTFPLHLNVTGSPMINGLSNLYFDTIAVGNYSQVLYSIYNNGTDTLHIDSLLLSETHFSISGPESFVILPGQSVQVPVVFTPQLAQWYYGLLQIYSDAENQSVYTVNLEGYGNLPPSLYVNFDTIQASFAYGSTAAVTDFISNAGGDDLSFELSLDNPGGKSLDLDGNGDYINCVNAVSLNPDTAITLEAWIYPEDNHQEFILAKEYSNTGTYRLYLDENGKLKFQLNASKSVTSATTIPVGEWTHVAASSDGKRMQVFINGQPDGEVIFPPFTIQSNTFNLRLGRSHANEYFHGKMDEVRIWGVYKNETEVQSFMNQSLSGSEFGLILYYNFNESSGNIAQDLSLANNDGTLYGNASRAIQTPPIGGTMAVYPTSGVLLNAQQQVLTFNFQTIGLAAGSFHRLLSLHSNDPLKPLVQVPILWSLSGNSDLSASLDSLAFDDTYLGQTDTLDLSIVNNGPVPITISGWNFSSPAFAVDYAYMVVYPLSEKRVKVYFTPSLATTYDESLTIQCNAFNTSALVIPLHGTGLNPPHISINPSSFHQNLNWGQSASESLKIVNSGDGPLNWNLTGMDAQWLSMSQSVGTVLSHDSVLIDLIFNGSNQEGDYSSVLHLSSNDFSSPDLTIPVSMHVTGAELLLSQDTLTQWVTYQDTKTDTVYIQNTGIGPLEFLLTENVDWLSLNMYSGIVPVGGYLPLYLTYNGNYPHGDYQTDIQIQTNDADHLFENIQVNLQILHATLVSIPSSLNMGYAVKNIGKTSYFTLLNNGNVDLTIDSIYSDAPFTPQASYNTFLAAGQSLSVPVFFLPAATLIYNETIVVATSIGVFTVPVQGIGENPAPAWHYSWAMHDFGLTDVATGNSTVLYITNTGNVPWVMDDWDMSESHFSVSDTIFSLNPGQTKAVTVYFNPTAVSIYEASLQWTSNSIGTQEILLDGRGYFLSNSPVLSYSEEASYGGIEGVYPLIGSTSTYFQYKVVYTDADNHAPMAGYPVVGIDKNGDADFLDSGEDEFVLSEVDGADQQFTDGKEYVFNTTLPLNFDLGYSFYAFDILGNPSVGEAVAYRNDPTVSNDLLDLSIFANDINFSDLTPNVGQNIQITATIHNNSDYPASNISVRFYEEDTYLTELIIPYLGAQSAVNLSINHVFTIDEYYPIKVVIDEENYILEDNELNNFAIRPVLVGEFAIPGAIIATANVAPSLVQPYTTVHWYGHADYVGSYDPNTFVAGAQVTMTIVQTGFTYTTYTNANGDFSVYFQAPPTPGWYTIQGQVTDFTLLAQTNDVNFQVYIPQNEVILGPDLAITYWWGTDIHWTSDCRRIGDPIEVTAIVTNIGNQTAYNALVEVFQDNFMILNPVYDSIPAGTSKVINFIVNYATVGTHAVSVNIDPADAIAELNEWNNYGSRSRWIYPMEPDISPVYAWISDYSPLQGQPVNFTFQIDNLECSTSGATQAKIYHIFNGDTSLVATQPISQICATCYDYVYFYNQSYTEVGYHQLLIVTDFDDVIEETNELNNNLIIQFYVEQAISDLYISDISFSAYNPDLGDLINFTATIWNNGTADAEDFYVHFYSDGEQIGDSVHIALLPHGVNMLVTSDPWLVSECGHSIRAIVDEENLIPETNEYNNQTTRDAGYDFAPSLWPFYYSSHISVLVGTPVTLRSRIYNNGTFDADSVYVSYVINNSMIAYDGVPYIDHQSFASSGHIYTFPYTGEYDVYIYADRIWPDSTRYCELDESNNVVVLHVTVYGENPDLQVLSQHISPTELNPDPGENIDIFGSFTNQGNVPAGPFYIKFFVNSVPWGDSIYIAGLAAHEDSTVACTLPYSSQNIGTHIIRMNLDITGQVVEYNELNNEASRAIIVGDAPDHTFSNAGAGIWLSDTLPQLGDLITINGIIENNGGATGMALLSYYCVFQGDTTLIQSMPYTAAPYDSTDMPVQWLVNVPYGRIVARITNANPEEFNIYNNETHIDFGTPLSPIIANLTVSDGLICKGEEVTLSVNPTGGLQSYVISWSSIPAGFQATGTSIQVSPDATTVYTCVIEDGFHTVSVSSTVQVIDLTLDLGADASACAGQTLSLDAGIFNQYAWSTGETTQVISVNASGTYSVSISDANGCQNSDSLVISIFQLPQVNLGNDTSICAGQSTQVDAGQFTGFSWSNGSNAQILTLSETGFYAVTVTDNHGCQASDEVHLQVNPLPVVQLGADTSLCAGNQLVIDAGAQALFVWSSGETTQSIYVSQTGVYGVTVSSPNQCQASDELFVDFLPVPTPEVVQTSVLCAGGTTELHASGGISYNWNTGAQSNLIVTGAGGLYSVTVSNAAGCSAVISYTLTEHAVSQPVLIDETICYGFGISLYPGSYASYLWSNQSTDSTLAVSTAGQYSVTVQNAYGCSAAADMTLTVDHPQVELGSDQHLCPGNSLELQAGQAAMYSWSTGTSAQQLLVSQAGVYAVTITTLAGCTASDQIAILAAPQPILELGPDVFICQGSQTVLTAGYYDAYLWSTGSTTPSLVTSQAGVYHLTVYNQYACEASDSLTVSYNLPPSVSFIGLAAQYCAQSSSITLAGNPSGGIFTGPGVVGAVFNPSWLSPGSYLLNYSYQDGNGCMGSTQQIVAILALPELSIVGLNTEYYSDSQADTIVGLPVGGAFSGIGMSGAVFDPVVAGLGYHTIQYSYSDVNGCSSIISAITLVSTVYDIHGLVVYDNTLQEPLSGVSANLLQGGILLAGDVSDAAGVFDFYDFHNGTYQAEFSTQAAAGGMNATDALLIRRHVVFLEPLAGLRLEAADVNASNTVTSADALLVLRRTVGYISTFPAGSWLIGPQPVIISNHDTSMLAKGICFGDVNASYSPGSAKSNSDVELIRQGILSAIASEIQIPVYIDQDDWIGAATLVLGYDAKNLSITRVESAGEEFAYQLQDGLLICAMNDLDGLPPGTETPVFTLFAKLSSPDANPAFNLLPESEIADTHGNVCKARLIIPEIAKLSANTEIVLGELYPNPCKNTSKLPFYLPEKMQVRIFITTSLGVEIQEILNAQLEPGQHEITISSDKLSSGNYFYRMEADNDKYQFKSTGIMQIIK